MPFFSKDKSRIKMVILTKNGSPNTTFYSPIDQNKKPCEFIMRGMLRRFMKSDIMKIAQIVQFYDQDNRGELIKKIKVE